MPKNANPRSSALRIKYPHVAVEEPQRLEISGHRHRVLRQSARSRLPSYKTKSRRVNRRANSCQVQVSMVPRPRNVPAPAIRQREILNREELQGSLTGSAGLLSGGGVCCPAAGGLLTGSAGLKPAPNWPEREHGAYKGTCSLWKGGCRLNSRSSGQSPRSGNPAPHGSARTPPLTAKPSPPSPCAAASVTHSTELQCSMCMATSRPRSRSARKISAYGTSPVPTGRSPLLIGVVDGVLDMAVDDAVSVARDNLQRGRCPRRSNWWGHSSARSLDDRPVPSAARPAPACARNRAGRPPAQSGCHAPPTARRPRV